MASQTKTDGRTEGRATIMANRKGDKMNYEEAKKANTEGITIYRAYYEGRVWSAGRMVEVDDTIGYYETEEEAKKACEDYVMIDFDSKHCRADVELCDSGEFDF